MAKKQPGVFRKKVPNERIFGIPREVRVHRLVSEIQAQGAPFTANFLNYERGMFSTFLDMEHLEGRPVKVSEQVEIGKLIGTVERRTRLFLQRSSCDDAADFFDTAWRSKRYDVLSIVNGFIRWSGIPFRGFETIASDLAQSIDAQKLLVQQSDRVLSHLDPFPKNFIRRDGQIFLIDWGESYVGRAGFDAGCFLMVMLRHYNVRDFEAAAGQFLHSYLSAADIEPTGRLVASINRIFLPRSLWSLLRPDVVGRVHAKGTRIEWLAKFDLLSRAVSGELWRDLKIGLADRTR